MCKNLLKHLGYVDVTPPNFYKEDQWSHKVYIAAGGCMIYLFVIDTTLINEEAMWPMQYRYDDKRQMNQGMRLIREPNFACC